MFYIIVTLIVIILVYRFFYKMPKERMKVWIVANRLAFAYKYGHENDDKLDDEKNAKWRELLGILPDSIAKDLEKSTYKFKLVVKYLIIEQMFNEGDFRTLLPDVVLKNYNLFLECAFIKKALVNGKIEAFGITNRENGVEFISALDQISSAVDNNFPDNSTTTHQMELNPDEIILPILFPILRKNFPEETVTALENDKMLIYGTPYYGYLFLLHKWNFLNLNDTGFQNASLKEKQRHLIFDRGAGNDSTYSEEEIKIITNENIDNSDEAILAIVKHELFYDNTLFTKEQNELNWQKFMEIKPELKKTYLG